MVRSVPESWTDLRQVDTFEAASDGRAMFRPDDLLLLRELVDNMIKNNYPK